MVLGGIPLDFHDLMVDMTSILFEDLKERKVGIQLQIWPCGSKRSLTFSSLTFVGL